MKGLNMPKPAQRQISNSICNFIDGFSCSDCTALNDRMICE